MQGWRSSDRGFTLTELLVAAAVGSIVVAMSGWAMVAILQNNRRVEEQAMTRMNLSRALDFISDDIRSAIRISTTAPSDWTIPSGGYQLVMFIEKPADNLEEQDNGTLASTTRVAYYTRPKTSGVVWRGPMILYRQKIGDSTPNALIDGIASTSPTCTNNLAGAADSGTNKGGFRVFVQHNRNVKLCIAGLVESTGTVYQAETLAAVRSGSATPTP
ncbi:prepilin-type N-terminal cleavage/methylation domain-containing protein [Thermosynechococcus sp. HN-54]|uniref:PulJ/GspJ family protein n=1 Tax=Thermosynechococcus sp. HN-54 TaxID=2933959 RepID=UPI00202CB63E|nr:prepilin-type N-terminal cleavage/methylation domain-containing protein [Thermosynechococcus sp. HN-54]URR34713.1 prepilin-type N-terminal cleavage/methylation domain-containing protein [Thermosynechococcus sp. HN-54]